MHWYIKSGLLEHVKMLLYIAGQRSRIIDPDRYKGQIKRYFGQINHFIVHSHSHSRAIDSEVVSACLCSFEVSQANLLQVLLQQWPVLDLCTNKCYGTTEPESAEIHDQLGNKSAGDTFIAHLVYLYCCVLNWNWNPCCWNINIANIAKKFIIYFSFRIHMLLEYMVQSWLLLSGFANEVNRASPL